jgi:hypothetical protein
MDVRGGSALDAGLDGDLCHAEPERLARPSVSGRRVPEADQRQIQAADHVGPQGWAAPLRRDQVGLLRGLAGSAEIAPRVLSRELKALAASGLIDRKDFGTVPPKVEYRLTRKGQSFIPVVDAIRGWSAGHLAREAEELAA